METIEKKIIQELKIDDEFRDLLPSLSEEGFKGLETDIVDRGAILHPILTWEGIIIDGHHRYAIGHKHGIDFEVKEIVFNSRDDVKFWIFTQQMLKRNLNDFERTKIALKLKDIIENKAKANQRAAGGVVPSKSAKPIDTRKEIARIAGVSTDTVRKVEKISEQSSEEDLEKLRFGNASINSVFKKIQCSTEIQSQVSRSCEGKVQGIIMKIKSLVDQLVEGDEIFSEDDKKSIKKIITDLEDCIASNATASQACRDAPKIDDHGHNHVNTPASNL
jgi:hypothetical protein